MPEPVFEVCDLREHQQFCDAVADRAWKAWWRDRGYPLDLIAGLVQSNLAGRPVPFCVVAHRGDVFLGTASLIAADLEERPDLTPWVAGVWVDAEYRRQGVGGALVRKALELAGQRGNPSPDLCAANAKRSFYKGLGWALIEENVGPDALDGFRWPGGNNP